MKTYPFTAEGFAALLSELYALPDESLNSEASALLADFRNWTSSHFEFSSTQLTYLQKLDDRFINNAAQNSHAFMIKRLPISLIKPDTAAKAAADGEGKIIILGTATAIQYSDESGVAETESLTYTISYT